MALRQLFFKVGFQVKDAGLRKANDAVKDLTQRMAGGAVEKFERGLKSVGKAAGSAAAGIGKAAASMTKAAAAAGAVAIAAGTIAGISLAKEMIGGAAELEQQQIQLEALVGNAQQADDLFERMSKRGAISTFSETDFIEGAKSFLPLVQQMESSKRVPFVDQITGLQERLAASNPLEGMQGAAFSIREALSGDTVSLAERFNVPKSMLTALKSAGTLEQKAVVLDKVLSNMGYTQEYLDKVGKSAASMWDNMQSNAQMAMKKAGGAALEALKPIMTQINAFLGGGGADTFFNAFGQGLAGAINQAGKFANVIITSWPMIRAIFAEVGNTVRPILQEFQKNFQVAGPAAAQMAAAIMPAVRAVGSVIRSVFTALGPIFDAGRNLFQMLATVAPPMMRMVSAAVAAAGPIISTIISKVSQIIAALVNNVIVPLLPYAAAIIGSALGLAARVFTALQPVINAVGSIIVWLVNTVVKPLVPVIGTLLLGAWRVAEVPLNLIVVAIEKIGGAVRKVTGWIGDFKDGLSKLKNIEIGLPKFMGGDGLVQLPSHATGLRRVPFDGYVAELHAGERVLTKAESRAYNRAEAATLSNITPETSPGYSRTYSDNSSTFSPIINLYNTGATDQAGSIRQDIFKALDEYWNSMGRRVPRVTEG